MLFPLALSLSMTISPSIRVSKMCTFKSSWLGNRIPDTWKHALSRSKKYTSFSLSMSIMYRVPSAFHETRYGFSPSSTIFLISIETGWEPGKPLPSNLHILCTVSCNLPNRGCNFHGNNQLKSYITIICRMISVYLIGNEMYTLHTGHECGIRIEKFLSSLLFWHILWTRTSTTFTIFCIIGIIISRII